MCVEGLEEEQLLENRNLDVQARAGRDTLCIVDCRSRSPGLWY